MPLFSRKSRDCGTIRHIAAILLMRKNIFCSLRDAPHAWNFLLIQGNTVMTAETAKNRQDVGELNQIIVYGQSLAAGATGLPLLPPAAVAEHQTYAGGTRGGVRGEQNFSAAKPLEEDALNPAPDGMDNRGETVCSGAASYASALALRENGIDPAAHPLFISSAGKSGACITELQKGSAWYRDQFMQHLRGICAFSPHRALRAIFWLQGETNSDGRETAGTAEEYTAALRQLREDISAEARAVHGQAAPVPFIVYQHSTNIKTNPNTARSFFRLVCDEDSQFSFSAPTYMFPHAEDGLHLTAEGYRWLGCYFGRAYKQRVHDRIRPRFIRPLSLHADGGAVRITFSVPQPPLVLDNVNLAPAKDCGFSVYQNGRRLALRAVSIEGGDTVVLETAEDLLSDVTVKYAMDDLGEGLNIQAGASGNLRDSTAETVDINGRERPMFYLCPHFEIGGAE